MLKWGIFNASLLLNEHGHPPFYFKIVVLVINIQWTKFERKSIVTFISEELRQVNCHDRATSFNSFFLLAPPSIYYVDPPTETGTEENVTFTCHASGLPQPTFTWITPDGHAVNATAPVYESEVLNDGSEIIRGKIVQEDGSLLIFNTLVADQGVYKCVAINAVGQDDKTVNLTVKEGKNRISHLPF